MMLLQLLFDLYIHVSTAAVYRVLCVCVAVLSIEN